MTDDALFMNVLAATPISAMLFLRAFFLQDRAYRSTAVANRRRSECLRFHMPISLCEVCRDVRNQCRQRAPRVSANSSLGSTFESCSYRMSRSLASKNTPFCTSCGHGYPGAFFSHSFQ